MIYVFKHGESIKKDSKDHVIDWENWIERFKKIINEAQDSSDDDLFKYNMGTKITEVQMLLEMAGYIEPKMFEIKMEDYVAENDK